MKQGDYHFFDIGTEQFACILDYHYKNRWLWYSSDNNSHCLFRIDLSRGFKTKEACEAYIKSKVKATCKSLLKGFKND